MTTSVCMGTYNGERFILEQLDTIRRQSKVPDEVIICDDCSTDSTVKIIKEFIEEHELGKSWKLLDNTENKGYPGNFYYAMSLCTKEVVFLADQDDIWELHKIEEMCKVMEQNSKIKVLACKFNLIDENGKVIETIMQPIKSTNKGNLKKINFINVLKKYCWPGMVIAYNNRWYKEFFYIDDSEIKIPHDQLIILSSADEENLYQLDYSLASHRRHENNTAKEEHELSKLLTVKRKKEEIERYISLLEELNNINVISHINNEFLKEKICSLEQRYKAINLRKVGLVIINTVKYYKFFRIHTFLCDVYLCLYDYKK